MLKLLIFITLCVLIVQAHFDVSSEEQFQDDNLDGKQSINDIVGSFMKVVSGKFYFKITLLSNHKIEIIFQVL